MKNEKLMGLIQIQDFLMLLFHSNQFVRTNSLIWDNISPRFIFKYTSDKYKQVTSLLQ